MIVIHGSLMLGGGAQQMAPVMDQLSAVVGPSCSAELCALDRHFFGGKATG